MLYLLDKAVKKTTNKKAIILHNGEEQLQDVFFSVVSYPHNVIPPKRK
jgi:hypothetical protein